MANLSPNIEPNLPSCLESFVKEKEKSIGQSVQWMQEIFPDHPFEQNNKYLNSKELKVFNQVHRKPKNYESRFDGNYIFLDKIGEGKSARVVKAYNKISDTYEAMKLYDIKTVGNNFMMNNEHEILNTIQALKNDRFLKYYGILSYKQQEGLCLLSMEYGEATLSNILKAGKNYASEELASVMESVVESFKILQDNGICNRDVKPQNIILVKKTYNEYDFRCQILELAMYFLRIQKVPLSHQIQ